ncbi:hypothetical protein QTA56_11295 [Acinetobacter sp. VNH17]|uniref:Uncharacterized protein n=1 Tax=Acinetobacter thutiue TaxID=2998078 RepID=A0ABT7WQ78_9GAMM|nr:hypothetical protein [Acinetobacter thutiue]MCY6412706.1 hypothetical protein [Acinetobacter thutiue]MDN0014813.1 hypothetical protein [Acinetobacter thutiue]
MSLGAIYLWEPEIFTGDLPDINDSERAAYDLYQQHRNTASEGKTLQAWIDYIAIKVTDPQYSEFFSDEIQEWMVGLQQGLKAQPRAMLELEHFDILAQGDALYRVFYEAVQASGVGFYEPYFAVWGMGLLQTPFGAVEQVLASFLKPLSTQAQTFNLEDIEPPRNIKKAEELVRLWTAQHPYAKNLKLYIYNIGHDFINPWRNIEHPELAPDEGYRSCLFIDEVKGIFYQLKMSFGKLTKSPMVSFSMDLTSHFIPKEQQEALQEKLIIRLLDQDIRTPVLNEQGYLELKYYLTGRWDNRTSIQKFFRGFDGYVSFIFAHLGNGNLKELQAWAYGDMPEGLIIQLYYKTRMMIYAVSLDQDALDQCYEQSKKEFSEEKELFYLEQNYLFYNDILKIVQEAGTALPPYQKKVI